MGTRISRRPSAGGIAGICALVLVVAGGSAVAATQLTRNSVQSKHIAADAVTNKQTRNMTVLAPRNVPAFVGNELDAPTITLLRRGPFRIYVRCLAPGAGTQARVYLGNTKNGAIGRLGATVYDGYGVPTYIPKSPAISLVPSGAVSENTASVYDWGILAISGKVSIQASVTAFLKGGTLNGGNGTYGAGKRCIFKATETGTG